MTEPFFFKKKKKARVPHVAERRGEGASLVPYSAERRKKTGDAAIHHSRSRSFALDDDVAQFCQRWMCDYLYAEKDPSKKFESAAMTQDGSFHVFLWFGLSSAMALRENPSPHQTKIERQRQTAHKLTYKQISHARY